MRTSGYTFQQALTIESTNIVKQAISLAKRRGHSHVTPLHVASVMLVSSSSCLLKKACLQSHTHPLQYKALELCFNVALNRLPTSSSSSSPIFDHQPHHILQIPCLSNALVAAFKRAQAYQRRGSIESQQQQQNILVLKVEIEQLVISILDDPSVSRVMREAGFSSIQLKTYVEQAISLDSFSKDHRIKPMVQTTPSSSSLSLSKLGDDQVKNDDVMSVIESMMNYKKRKNTILVGECLTNLEGVVKGVIDKFDKGEILGEMKHVKFISVPLFTLRNVCKQEFEIKLVELRSLLTSYINRGVVLYLGDLKWISEFWNKYCEQSKSTNYYSPVEHMIMELSRLLCDEMREENGRIWLMGIASFQTYLKCKSGCPSLQTLWDLHPLTIPVVTLALSLNIESDMQSHISTVVKTESTTPSYNNSSLPSWLRKYKEVTRQEHHTQEFEGKDSTINMLDDIKPELLSNPNSSPNSASSSEASEYYMNNLEKFKEFNSDNMKILCKIFEKKVPWQKEIIPDIIRTILECRQKKKENTWLFFLGADFEGKEKISREIAKVMFGSQDSFISIGISSFSSSTKGDDSSDQEVSNKRSRDEQGMSYLERFANAIQENPRRVFFMEDVDQVDFLTQKGIKKAIESGSLLLTHANGELVCVKDSIIIFNCEDFNSNSPINIQKCVDIDEEKKENDVSLDLNIIATKDDIGILEVVDKIVMFNIHIL